MVNLRVKLYIPRNVDRKSFEKSLDEFLEQRKDCCRFEKFYDNNHLTTSTIHGSLTRMVTCDIANCEPLGRITSVNREGADMFVNISVSEDSDIIEAHQNGRDEFFPRMFGVEISPHAHRGRTDFRQTYAVERIISLDYIKDASSPRYEKIIVDVDQEGVHDGNL